MLTAMLARAKEMFKSLGFIPYGLATELRRLGVDVEALESNMIAGRT